MKKFRVRGEITGMFVEGAEFATKKEALARYNKWLGIFDEVQMWEIK